MGRPLGHRFKVQPSHEKTIKKMLNEGASKTAMAEATGLSRPTIYRLLTKLQDSKEPRSLLRYPGGKARGKGIIAALTSMMGETYAEPFFGGGSICLALIRRNCITRAIINDADPRVASFWTAVIQEPGKLAAKIAKFEPTVHPA